MFKIHHLLLFLLPLLASTTAIHPSAYGGRPERPPYPKQPDHHESPYPTRSEILTHFSALSNPLTNGSTFMFNHVSPNVSWEITGQNPSSGIYTRDEIYAFWLNLGSQLRYPGLTLVVAEEEYGEGAVIVGADGWATVQVRSVNTFVQGNGTAYEQDYSWTVKYGRDKRIERMVAYLDSWYLDQYFPFEADP